MTRTAAASGDVGTRTCVAQGSAEAAHTGGTDMKDEGTTNSRDKTRVLRVSSRDKTRERRERILRIQCASQWATAESAVRCDGTAEHWFRTVLQDGQAHAPDLVALYADTGQLLFVPRGLPFPLLLKLHSRPNIRKQMPSPPALADRPNWQLWGQLGKAKVHAGVRHWAEPLQSTVGWAD